MWNRNFIDKVYSDIDVVYSDGNSFYRSAIKKKKIKQNHKTNKQPKHQQKNTFTTCMS